MGRTARGMARVRTSWYGTHVGCIEPGLDFRHVGLKSTTRLEIEQNTAREKVRFIFL